MKKLLIFILLAGISLHVTAQMKLKGGVIAFYNVENLFDTINTEGVQDEDFTPDGLNKWNSERYVEKIGRLAGIISRLGADDGIPGGPAVIGLSEIENRSVLEDLAAHPLLAPAAYRIIHFDSPDLRGIDVGLLYQPRYFEPSGAVSAELPLYDDDGSRIYTRDQLVVSGQFDGNEMHFIVNHWPSRSGGEEASRLRRNAAAALTRSLTDSILSINPEAKIIIMGDLNDDPVNESVKDILRAGDSVDDLGPGDLFNCMFPMFKKGAGSLAYNGVWNLFDQIIVSQGLLENDYSSYGYYAARVYNKEILTQKDGQYKGYPLRTYVGTTYQGGYSDHFPVYIILVAEAKD